MAQYLTYLFALLRFAKLSRDSVMSYGGGSQDRLTYSNRTIIPDSGGHFELCDPAMSETAPAGPVSLFDGQKNKMADKTCLGRATPSRQHRTRPEPEPSCFLQQCEEQPDTLQVESELSQYVGSLTLE